MAVIRQPLNSGPSIVHAARAASLRARNAPLSVPMISSVRMTTSILSARTCSSRSSRPSRARRSRDSGSRTSSVSTGACTCRRAGKRVGAQEHLTTATAMYREMDRPSGWSRRRQRQPRSRRTKGRRTMTTTSPRSQIISISDLGWQEFRPGISFKILWEDKATKRRAQMTRFAPGAQLPLHRHVRDELIFVIEGALSDESGTVTSGNVGYRPDGCVHTVTTKNGATVLAVLTGDIEPAAERGRAPGSQIFTLSELPWIETRPGVRQKRIWEDKVTERRALLARFEPGATPPPPRPVGDEQIFLVQGPNAGEAGGVAR